MANLEGYDANDYEPAGDFSPIPEGEYVGIITESEWRDTKSGNGRYLYVVVQVAEGDHQGRLLFDPLNP